MFFEKYDWDIASYAADNTPHTYLGLYTIFAS